MTAIFVVGTYTRPLGHVDGKASGIHVLRHEPVTDRFEVIASNIDCLGDGPSYVCTLRAATVDEHLNLVVAACNEGEADLVPSTMTVGQLVIPWTSEGGAAVIGTTTAAAVHIGPPTPCHVATNSQKQWLCAATYMGGSITLHGIDTEGDQVVLTDAISTVVNSKHSDVDPGRQEAAHAHHVLFLRDDVVLLCDLGADCIYWYRIVDRSLQLVGETTLPAGSGPRHCVRSQCGTFVYVLGELNNTIYTCKVQEDTMTVIASVSCEPTVGGGGAAIVMDYERQLLFVSLRRSNGQDSVDVFSTATDNGTLVPVGRLTGFGRCPRDMCLHPSLPYLYVASQNDNIISAYRYTLDGATVSFDEARTVHCPTPVCLVPFVRDAPSTV